MMRLATLIAGAVFLATPAAARTMGCSLSDKLGNTLTYGFTVGPAYWVEVSFSKNGAMEVHPPGKRPRWPAKSVAGRQGRVLTYAPDPRYAMVVSGLVEVQDGVRMYPVFVGRVDTDLVVSHGYCAWVDELPGNRPDELSGAYE
jgi:hypothetical protein